MGCTVGRELIGHDAIWDITLGFQQVVRIRNSQPSTPRSTIISTMTTI